MAVGEENSVFMGMAVERWVPKGGGSLAEHFRDDEDEDRTTEAAPKQEVDQGIASGSNDGSEEQGEHGIGMG